MVAEGWSMMTLTISLISGSGQYLFLAIQRALKLRDVAVSLPKLYVVTVNELFGVFFGGVVIGTKKLYRSEEVAIAVNDIRSILRHCVQSAGSVPVPACVQYAHFQDRVCPL
jgi:hypothetical protein